MSISVVCVHTDPDKAFIFQPKSIYIFLISFFLHKNLCCGYSLDVPCPVAFNEYPQFMKNILQIHHLIWSYDFIMVHLSYIVLNILTCNAIAI